MPESKNHKKTAERLARKFNTTYNNGQGVDIKTSSKTIEVETANTVNDAKRQLQGHKGSVYIAGADKSATTAALEAVKGTTIGVMDSNGNILKRSTRK